MDVWLSLLFSYSSFKSPFFQLDGLRLLAIMQNRRASPLHMLLLGVKHRPTWRLWLAARLIRVKEQGGTKKKLRVGREQLSRYMYMLDAGESDARRMKAKSKHSPISLRGKGRRGRERERRHVQNVRRRLIIDFFF